MQGLGVVPGHEEEAEGPRTAVKEEMPRLGLECKILIIPLLVVDVTIKVCSD